MPVFASVSVMLITFGFRKQLEDRYRTVRAVSEPEPSWYLASTIPLVRQWTLGKPRLKICQAVPVEGLEAF